MTTLRTRIATGGALTVLSVAGLTAPGPAQAAVPADRLSSASDLDVTRSNVRVCRNNPPLLTTTVAWISVRGSATCWGTSKTPMKTQCRIQERYGWVGNYRWIDRAPAYRAVGPQGCLVRLKREDGRFRGLTRHCQDFCTKWRATSGLSIRA